MNRAKQLYDGGFDAGVENEKLWWLVCLADESDYDVFGPWDSRQEVERYKSLYKACPRTHIIDYRTMREMAGKGNG